MPKTEHTQPGEVKAVPPVENANDTPNSDHTFADALRDSDQKSVQPAPELFVEKPREEAPVGETGMIPATSIHTTTASIHRDAIETGKTWRELLKDDYRSRVDAALALEATSNDPNAVNVDLQTIAALAKLLDALQEEGVIRGDSVVQRLQAKTDRL